ncbi:MAG: HlyD family efflux transporter periplasmic adaptor subunit, partial [Planctomycetaceae bacterium]|nr:HlyD family efflux transporter periplasmic adaptor subunit [Planctomycetaceae bacterium]
KRKQIVQTLQNFLFLRLPGWDPERTLNAIYPFFKWMYTTWAVALVVILAAAALLLVSIQFEEFQSKLPEFQQFFGWPNLLYMYLVIAGAKVIHEFGHGLTCRHFGGECHKIGVMLLVFSPTLYCDVSDSWMMKNKWHRIWIGGAGAYIEVFLSSIAVFAWWFSQPGLFNYLCLNLFFVTTISTVIFNLNPLIRFDGYYMLSDYLEIPNLKQKADKALMKAFAWYCLGIHLPDDPFAPDRNRHWFILYAVASWIYKWVLVLSIALFLYTWMKPYGLQNVAVMLTLASLGTMLFGLGKSLYQILSMPRNEPMSKLKIAFSSVLAVGVLGAILAIPVPWWIHSSFTLEPYHVEHVYSFSSGHLKQVAVEPGQDVQQGDVLLILENEELDDQKRDYEAQLDVANAARNTAVALNSPDEVKMADERIASINDQLQSVTRQIDQLTVRAPISGKIVAAESVPEQKLPGSGKRNLRSWYGTVFQERNQGALIEVGTHLMSVAPSDAMQAVLLVSQDDRNELHLGTPVLMRCYHLPDQIFEGVITEIADRQSDYAPRQLSNKSGGDLATVTDQEGREKLTELAYQATVKLSEQTDLMFSGLSGRARFIVDKRSIGGWIWRYIRQTFHFRL